MKKLLIFVAMIPMLFCSGNLKAQTQEIPNCADVISAGSDHSLALKNGMVWAWGSNSFGKLGDGTTVSSNVPSQVTGLENIIAVSAGIFHSLALKREADGTTSVYAWGRNNYGQLGNGLTTDSHVPVQVRGMDGQGFLSDIIAISAGDFHSLALKREADGTTSVYAWGRNNYGQLGNNSTANSNVPVQVQGNLTEVIAISAGSYHSLALKLESDGAKSVYAWGAGDGDDGYGSISNIMPVRVRGMDGQGFLSDVVSISVSYRFSLALKQETDGTTGLYGWGDSFDGQLGPFSRIFNPLPIQVQTSLTDIVTMSAGEVHVLAVGVSGPVYAWGNNYSGQLGNGSTASSNVPIPVTGLGGQESSTKVKAISTGSYYSLALKEEADGTKSVYAWGINYVGQLGNNSTTGSYVPILVHNLDGITCSQSCVPNIEVCNDGIDNDCDGQIDEGEEEVCDGIDNDCDGQRDEGFTAVLEICDELDNDCDGQIDEDSVCGKMAKELACPTISAGAYHALAVKGDGSKVWTWGALARTTLSEGVDSYSFATPIQVCAGRFRPIMPCEHGHLTNVTAVSASSSSGGNSFNFALHRQSRQDGDIVLGWGNSSYCGVVNAELPLLDKVVSPCRVARFLSGNDPDGGIVCDEYFDDHVTAVSAGDTFGLALDENGAVWGWGCNNHGQLGDGTETDCREVIRVCEDYDVDNNSCRRYFDDVAAISAARGKSMALKNDGTVWRWPGKGYVGSEPIAPFHMLDQTGDDYLRGVVAISAGGYQNLALKSNGTVWAWGNNIRGSLGDGTTASHYTTPVQVCADKLCNSYLTNIIAISSGDDHSLALKSNGTVWTWGGLAHYGSGEGSSGLIGDFTVPVQVCADYNSDNTVCNTYLTGIIGISAGYDYNLALKDDGTVWAWGWYHKGQLGNGMICDAESNEPCYLRTPVQVSGVSGVTCKVACVLNNDEFHNCKDDDCDGVPDEGTECSCLEGTLYGDDGAVCERRGTWNHVSQNCEGSLVCSMPRRIVCTEEGLKCECEGSPCYVSLYTGNSGSGHSEGDCSLNGVYDENCVCEVERCPYGQKFSCDPDRFGNLTVACKTCTKIEMSGDDPISECLEGVKPEESNEGNPTPPSSDPVKCEKSLLKMGLGNSLGKNRSGTIRRKYDFAFDGYMFELLNLWKLRNDNKYRADIQVTRYGAPVGRVKEIIEGETRMVSVSRRLCVEFMKSDGTVGMFLAKQGDCCKADEIKQSFIKRAYNYVRNLFSRDKKKSSPKQVSPKMEMRSSPKKVEKK